VGLFLLKAEHKPIEATAQAEDVVSFLKAEKFNEAYELPLENVRTGATLTFFKHPETEVLRGR
jgi:hypothetical protein